MVLKSSVDKASPSFHIKINTKCNITFLGNGALYTSLRHRQTFYIVQIFYFTNTRIHNVPKAILLPEEEISCFRNVVYVWVCKRKQTMKKVQLCFSDTYKVFTYEKFIIDFNTLITICVKELVLKINIKDIQLLWSCVLPPCGLMGISEEDTAPMFQI
jgi:hypothetical protein